MSDIHGHFHPARALLDYAKIDLKGGDSLRFLGDYIDRGPHSLDCMNMVMEWQKNGAKAHMGNHEMMLLMYAAGEIDRQTYYINGGNKTIKSFYAAGLSQAHLGRYLRWIATLKLTDQDDEYFYVHAGIHPNKQLAGQTSEDFLWIREEFLMAKQEWLEEQTDGRIIVHGHTPMHGVCFDGVRINTDLGAGGRKKLALVELNERIAYVYDFERAKEHGEEFAIKKVDIKEAVAEQLYKG